MRGDSAGHGEPSDAPSFAHRVWPDFAKFGRKEDFFPHRTSFPTPPPQNEGGHLSHLVHWVGKDVGWGKVSVCRAKYEANQNLVKVLQYSRNWLNRSTRPLAIGVYDMPVYHAILVETEAKR